MIYIQSQKDLVDSIETLGIVPFFENNIKGFSIEENINPKYYFSDEPGVWEWKGPVIQETRCAYGKFFNKKAAFIRKDLYYDYANYRRDGYDFDAATSDGLINYNEQFLYDIISSKHSMLSKTAKAIGGYVKPKEKGKDAWIPRKGFDTNINKLMMKGYIIIIDFDYEVDKNGEFYGWGIARYSTPEQFYGKGFSKQCYKRSPEASYKRLFNQIKSINPDASNEDIEKFLK